MNEERIAGFVGVKTAARRYGIGQPTITRMIRSGELTAYALPRDKRFTLLRIEDLERVSQPKPIAQDARATQPASAA